MRWSTVRDQIFLGFFFLIWFGSSTLAHQIGRDFFAVAREVRAADNDEGVAEAGLQRLGGKAAGLAVLNLPLFVAIGPMIRAEDPVPGPLYWLLVVVGGIYVPFFATLCLFFLLHAPSQGSLMPGVEWDDGSREENEEELSDDDADRKP